MQPNCRRLCTLYAAVRVRQISDGRIPDLGKGFLNEESVPSCLETVISEIILGSFDLVFKENFKYYIGN